MQINHSFDLSPVLDTNIEILTNASYFIVAEKVKDDGGFDCAGTVGSAGSIGGTLGTFGSFGCCC